MSDKDSSALVEDFNQIKERKRDVKEDLRERIETGDILSEDLDMIEEAVNLVYQHSGNSQDRLYTEMFHVRLQNLKDSGYNIDTKRTAIESALRYSVEQDSAKIRMLAAYLAAISDEQYDSMLKINIDGNY